MATCRGLFCSRKKSLLSIVVIMLLLLGLDIVLRKEITKNILGQVTRRENSSVSAAHHHSDIITKSREPELADPDRKSDLGQVICKSPQRKMNWTSCSGCLRPAVAEFDNNSFWEIALDTGFASNQSTDYFKLRPEIVQHLIADYVIVPALNICSAYLLAVQPSILARRQERDLIRSTWGSVAENQTWPNRKINANVKLLFVVARHLTQDGAHINVTRSKDEFEEIKSEADLHNDILYLDMIDSYRNLTLKILSAFKWVKDNCPCVKFVLKVDFDTFVNIPLLVDTLLYFEDRFEFSVVGGVYTANDVKRRGKWAIPWQLFPQAIFPPHASGCGYVLSFKVLSRIVDAAPYIPMLAIEDAFITGVMRRVIGCRLHNFQYLFTYRDDRSWYQCLMLQDKKILGTNTNVGKKQYVIWNSFVNNKCK